MPPMVTSRVSTTLDPEQGQRDGDEAAALPGSRRHVA
jgi:hypothetical protein